MLLIEVMQAEFGIAPLIVALLRCALRASGRLSVVLRAKDEMLTFSASVISSDMVAESSNQDHHQTGTRRYR
jgi:hypothetical protein